MRNVLSRGVGVSIAVEEVVLAVVIGRGNGVILIGGGRIKVLDRNNGLGGRTSGTLFVMLENLLLLLESLGGDIVTGEYSAEVPGGILEEDSGEYVLHFTECSAGVCVISKESGEHSRAFLMFSSVRSKIVLFLSFNKFESFVFIVSSSKSDSRIFVLGILRGSGRGRGRGSGGGSAREGVRKPIVAA